MSIVQIDDLQTLEIESPREGSWQSIGHKSAEELQIPIKAVARILWARGFYATVSHGTATRYMKGTPLIWQSSDPEEQPLFLPGSQKPDLQIYAVGVPSVLGNLTYRVPMAQSPINSLIRTRLSGLRNLEDGWLDGYGLAPSPDGVDWLIDQFESLYDVALLTPYTYPTPEGGVQCEWRFDPQDITLEVNLESRTAEWHRLNLLTEHEETRSLNLNARNDWQWLCKAIRQWSSRQRER